MFVIPTNWGAQMEQLFTKITSEELDHFWRVTALLFETEGTDHHVCNTHEWCHVTLVWPQNHFWLEHRKQWDHFLLFPLQHLSDDSTFFLHFCPVTPDIMMFLLMEAVWSVAPTKCQYFEMKWVQVFNSKYEAQHIHRDHTYGTVRVYRLSEHTCSLVSKHTLSGVCLVWN